MAEVELRKISFGKYKGKTIFELIMTHIGYVMWCLNNIKSFYLTDEEQMLYDAIAIGIIRDKLPMTFPIEGLKDFIKDKESLKKLDSPVVNAETGPYVELSHCNKALTDIFLTCEDLTKRIVKNSPIMGADSYEALAQEVSNLIEESDSIDDNMGYYFNW